jgi:serine carboxypeptidase-like clade 2
MPGHYIPQLAKLIIEINKKERVFNLKGIAVSSKIWDLNFVTK